MKTLITIIAFIVIPFLSFSQTADKVANEAFVLIRMVNKFHVEPREVNGRFSANVFSGMLDKTDANRIFFTKNDINRLSVYRTMLDKEIKLRKTSYLNLFINIYRQRLKQIDSLLDEISKKPFDFYAPEKLTAADDTISPISIASAQLKLRKLLKAGALDELVDDLPENFKSLAPLKQKKYTDSTLTVLQKKVISSLKRRIGNILQGPTELTQHVGNIYCETIASCFDPHTEFFPPQEKENFESALGKQPFKFGFTIKPDKNGGVDIDKLQAGSPAFKSGKLNKGDKFISLQWEGKQIEDISDVTMRELSRLLDENNHQKITFTVKKNDGSLVLVSLQKEQTTGGDDDKVKSFILKGVNTIGYIYLPAFYQDWESNNDGLNGCANDVGREILKLKKENINGLILDVRYNGGGSVHEATQLAGIFIDAGPVAQTKSREPKISPLNDVDRGTIYDGPLVILVNGYSASASELLAGTLQDYNRAVIIGTPTYGKATMQVVLPMDTTIAPQNFFQKKTDNYLKITISKLYRVNGTSAQFKGVQPDILLPDVLDAYIKKEADEPYALRPNTIAANKYYTPYTYLPIKTLAQNIQTVVDSSKYFNAVKYVVDQAKQKKAAKDISLTVKDALAVNDQEQKKDENTIIQGNVSKKITVLNNPTETTRLLADKDLYDLNEEFSHRVQSDAYINIAYDVLLKLKP
jgi:carboxyl-terminal processing protease